MTLFPALEAYYDPSCLANIVSLDLLQNHYHVVFDPSIANTFIIYLDDNTRVVFQSFRNGLYMHKLNQVNSYSFLHIVSENMSFYTRQEVRGADTAREQQGQIGWPSDQEYYKIVRDNQMKNNICSLHDIKRADHIYGGHAVYLLKGNSTYKAINVKQDIERIPLPPIILETHPTDELDIDFLYVQGAPYLLVKSQLIKFQGILSFNKISRIIKKKKVKNSYKRGPKDIITGLEKIIRLFNQHGFNITLVNADNKHKKIEEDISVP